MDPNDADLRAKLSEAWQKAARDLMDAGAPAKNVFESLLAVGLAGHVELYGKRATAQILLGLVETIDREAGEEAAAIREASAEAARSTRN
ncbi:hypothetical protein [Antarcticirhabdus aurantiaca]|uniref:Uncharacterized protein n=1 Tax=Antarcticirhabdus aurantiaca TaxID=2606717 RepID=A0ACD4NI59_9HYPH|nr:hypothetical protein [Antarcticirhabdus aurantiaca]WAJ26468.1 hypothetical protein OXU80_16460 [Jeongeuplla avenae]